MSCSLRSLLVLLTALAAAADVQAADKGRRPAAHRAPAAPRHASHTKVNHYRRPAVHRHPVYRVRRPVSRSVRQPVRRTVVRRVHRYPVHRVQRRYLRRPYYFGRYRGGRRYTYFYYPRRYAWRTNYYNRGYGGFYNAGYGVSRRRTSRGIAGIVESVQGNPNNGTLLVKVIRPRASRFRYARANGAGWGTTSQHRFHLNNNTLYQVMTTPPRIGTIADLYQGERVLILPQANSTRTAQRVQVFR